MNYLTLVSYRIGDNGCLEKCSLGSLIDANRFTTGEIIYILNQLANGREASLGGGAAPITRVWKVGD